MAEYKVGSLSNLISGKTDSVAAPTIIYEEVKQRKNPKRKVGNGSIGLSAESQKGRKQISKSLKTAFLPKKKPEIAGDEKSGAVVNSWRPMRKRENALDVDGSNKLEGSIYARNAARRVHLKNNTKKHSDDPEREGRTIYVGNIPVTHANKKKLLKRFSEYGEIESIRLRCAPVNDPRLAKKVAVIKQEFHPKRSNISAFILFKNDEQAKRALEADGSLYHDYHLRVDMARKTESEPDPRKCVFIGNLKFEAEEEDLWKLFSPCGQIRSVRVVRDSLTAVSKGLAFVNFESADGVELALQLDGELMGKRPITVKRYKPKPVKTSSHSSRSSSDRKKDSKSKDDKEKELLRNKLQKKKKDKRKKLREKNAGSAKDTPSESQNSELEDVTKNSSSSEKTSSKVFKNMKNKNNFAKTEEKVRSKNGASLSFEGQKVEKAKKKKKITNKSEWKKKKIALILCGKYVKK